MFYLGLFIYKYLKVLFLTKLILILFFVSSVFADEEKVRAQILSISKSIISKLPLDKKITLKTLSPETSGLPEEFLRKITSDFESSLLTASDFQIKLTNRLTTEEIWAEAMEFNNTDFQQIYETSGSDVLILLSPRATANGLEISASAYAIEGEQTGQVLVSTGSILLDMNLEENLGIDVTNLPEQMKELLLEIEQVSLSIINFFFLIFKRLLSINLISTKLIFLRYLFNDKGIFLRSQNNLMFLYLSIKM